MTQKSLPAAARTPGDLRKLCPGMENNWAFGITTAASLLHHGRIPVHFPTAARLAADLALLNPILNQQAAAIWAHRIIKSNNYKTVAMALKQEKTG